MCTSGVHTESPRPKPKQCSRLQLLLRQTLHVTRRDHVLLALVIAVVMVQAHLQVQVQVMVVVEQLAATKAAHDSHVEE